jgi:hypothetical protein
MFVVVHGVLVEEYVQVPWSGDQHPVGHLGPRTVRTQRSA